jgi:hypothetical protein
MIHTEINWPDGLPCVQREGHTTQHGTPFIRTELDSGRARQRRKFTSVPSVQQCSWVFTSLECIVFEAWFRDSLCDGVRWFNIYIRTPRGGKAWIDMDLRDAITDGTHLVCRFSEMYSGPDIVARDRWRISAPLEVWERPLIPDDWGLLPDYLLGADIFDRAMNLKWPREIPRWRILPDFAASPDIFDRAMNDKWPDA